MHPARRLAPILSAVFAVALGMIVVSRVTAAPASASPRAAERRAVDVVVCIDTSGSMQQLIDSARGRIWDIVNTLSKLEPTPELRVGILSYGTPGGSSEADGWVVRRTDLTSDLDTVYARLMELSTAGGDELVGRVLREAVDSMSWRRDRDALRLVFIAGNESADQGVQAHDFRVAARDARKNDILVNAIHAGSREQGVVDAWDQLARHGGGTFSSIDAELATIQITTPQDELLRELNDRLNETYIPFGQGGAAGLANQVAQDANATRVGVQSCSSRIVAKGTALYDNAHWDLVDAARDAAFKWDDLLDADLPENLRGLSTSDRRARVDSMRVQREGIQQRIQAASDAREAFLRAELARRRGTGTGLDDAMRETLLGAARGKGFNTDGC